MTENDFQSHVLHKPFDAYEGNEPYIFVSYKHSDYKIVYPVLKKLHDAGFNIWYDDGLFRGKNYDIEIARHIVNSSLFITFITEEVINCADDEDDYLIKELNVANNSKIEKLPIYLENVELKGFYLMHYLGIQSIFKHHYGDSEELFCDACINALKNDFGLKSNNPSTVSNANESYIYVSYAYDDFNRVNNEIKYFQDLGYNVCFNEFLNVENEYKDENKDLIKQSSVSVVFITSNYVKSDDTIKDIFIALQNKIPLIAIYLDNLEDIDLDLKLEFILSDIPSISKSNLNKQEYTNELTEYFSNYGLTIIKPPKAKVSSPILNEDSKLTNKYLKEFDKLNKSYNSIFELGDNNVLIILKNGDNLTDWNQVVNKNDIIYISEDLSDISDLSEKYKGLRSLKSIIISGMSENVSSMKSMFEGCKNLVDISSLNKLDVSNITDMGFLFKGCRNLTDISSLNNWNVANVNNMYSMFESCIKLIELSGLKNWDVSNVTTMDYMFSDCGIQEVASLKDWDVSNVTTMEAMFRGCSGLADIFSLKDWDVSEVTNMHSLFEGCFKLVNLFALTEWNVSKVTNMDSLFKSCEGLVDLFALTKWNVSNVTTMEYMFRGCEELVNLFSLKDWDVSNVINMRGMFSICRSLVDLNYLKNWNVSNVSTMRSMFYGCINLADISALKNWDVSSVTNMWTMFSYCGVLADLSALANWNVSNVTTMWAMFTYCSSLEDLSVLDNWNVSNQTNISSIFEGCNSIKKYPKFYELNDK